MTYIPATLDWHIVGPIGSTSGKTESVSCKQIADTAGTKEVLNNHSDQFEGTRKVKNIGIKMLEKTYKLDFTKSTVKIHDVVTKKFFTKLINKLKDTAFVIH